MSKENALMFLEKLRNENAVLDNSDSFEALVKEYAEKAKEAGENISEDDFAQALEEALRQRTNRAVSDICALEDAELEDVAGGKSYYYNGNGDDLVDGCIATQDGWCWSDDACYETMNIYSCDENYNSPDCISWSICKNSSNKISRKVRITWRPH